ncbi:hypothetical protein CRE_06886 [Caenorhabditis remanei]|uniref:BTB domain-containing protein n=1 Tax=Caenorhabditis remanei TaxID=31234 RepID=E3MZQ1_CAERE|nr:hypothetical protein CRE_06886 [Caenorhabditis remanei]
MANGAIVYRSDYHSVNEHTNVLETKSCYKIKCIWSGRIYGNQYNFTWKFNWNKLKKQGVDEITGHIYVSNSYTVLKIDVELTENNQVITKEFGSSHSDGDVYYTYSLTPHYTPVSEKPSDDEMFAPSDQNDAILIVDGKKLHVNKTFLSYHSEFFRALFSSNYKEGQMDEIPIGEVSYEDFALLLSTFYPNPVFVTDATVEKILELARRFLVSSVIKVTEHHLLNMSKIDNQKMLWLADEYGMPALLEKSIRGLDTLAKAKQMKKSQKYDQLSDKTKLKVFDRLMDFI